ncbi:Fe(3+)-transport system permease protein FbpB 2 [Clostridium pasteurianum DSM 525 = ATCC 6013]|uniref:ABC-type transporter, integral membrane subunit n=1 Tax=Clostridium pasteurianum DSM 525 = ATCC 6013 TaxID=1262449 RepID=A0A0H3JAI6_CLOPA|nr:iron ABC transporter permease [Clostridium pasteurianum]AJA48595.1 Fe(3+)-transport system permease protein FbpB 2 [Clostridium pasteurianum DSM 525 = ATCC 6013]AJA52583.1 Fe(3+)-transport system permease protein FbpB 2 [Clostridium pasteurianum DSM 525 = ATCC 6013]AOZ75826.1 iron ABC transporter [Clostridium pasteurianum DSM 525 = ATCC 6013]AOZ79622.1 iron ABC transporter [Clostridium pasteurianum]ELP57927.1 iron ABC transporter permease [Clostridium pasteurianum DSM 525 = ATCC 6013]
MKKFKFMKYKPSSWGLLSFISVLLVILPCMYILFHIFDKPNENWYHIKAFLLKDYIINTIKIVIATGFFTMIIGTTLAWLIAAYDFPCKRIFKWALILPLTIPTYIAAYTYNGIFNYTGVVQIFLRNVMKMNLDPKYFDIMSIKGVVFIFTIFLFPYVYMITRSFLEKQSATLIENARLLGRGGSDIFIHVILPISRGAIVGGTSLVLLEVLNDFGVVSYFGVQTFSTAIFKTWFSLGDTSTAVKLASMLMVTVFIVLIIEKWLRGRKKYSYTTAKVREIVPVKLKGVKAVGALLYCFSILSMGFIIPLLQLSHWSILTYKKILNFKFVGFMFNSIWLSIIVAVLIIVMSVVIANFCRINSHWISKVFSKISIMGYSIPGAVIAIGVILLMVSVDRKMVGIYKDIDSSSKTLVLSTSVFMLVFAYTIRFLAIGYQAIESGFDKIGMKFSEASRTLGYGVTKTFFKVDLPMMKPALISGFALVFVEIVKELPLTLILRPFNFNTLATKTYEYANDEMIHEASIPSLIIILVSIVSVYLLYRIENKERR